MFVLLAAHVATAAPPPPSQLGLSLPPCLLPLQKGGSGDSGEVKPRTGHLVSSLEDAVLAPMASRVDPLHLLIMGS